VKNLFKVKQIDEHLHFGDIVWVFTLSDATVDPNIGVHFGVDLEMYFQFSVI